MGNWNDTKEAYFGTEEMEENSFSERPEKKGCDDND